MKKIKNFNYNISHLLGNKMFDLDIQKWFKSYYKIASSIISPIYFMLDNYVIIYYPNDNDSKYINTYEKLFEEKIPVIISDNISLAKKHFIIPNVDCIYINTFSLKDIVIFSYFPNKILNKGINKLNDRFEEEMKKSNLYKKNSKYDFLKVVI